MPRHVTSLTPRELERALGSPSRVAPALRAIHNFSTRGRLPESVDGIAKHPWDAFLRSHTVPSFEIVERLVSKDGTIRLVLHLGKDPVETIIIPGAARTTACISCQSGCSRACRFCATSRLGFKRNLEAGEIVLQVLLAKEEAEAAGLKTPTNVVLMGMGEPLDNLEEVVRAIDVLVAHPLPGIGARHITVSTSGILPAIRPFLSRSAAQLALSLHATTDEDRLALVPHNRTWPIRPLLEEIRAALEDDGRLVLVEYLLLGGVNDSAADARRLSSLLESVPCRLNLIPYNPVEGLPFHEPSPESLSAFASVLSGAGVRTLVRHPRGRDVAAACGQLAGSVGPK